MAYRKYHAVFVTLLMCMIPAARVTAAGPQVAAVQAIEPPKLDGALDDACWKDCQEYTGFVDSSTRKPVEAQTFVRICYDQQNIYVGIRAVQPEPLTVKAVEKKRNGNFSADDYVQVGIDSAHAHRSTSSFTTNAIGTQAESIEATSATKIEWKGDWQAASKVVPGGYTVEMAIPFATLLYGKKQDTFGIYFARNHSGSQLTSVWPDLNGTWDLTYSADWVGIHPPWHRPRPVMMGYMLGTSATGSQVSSQGLDFRYPFSNDATALLSVHPDFGNVEQNVESVDFSYTQRYLSDNRPFFQEWGLPIDSRVFYSRSVTEAFDVGARFSGKTDRDTYGAMNIRTFGQRNDTIVAYSRNIGERSRFRFGLGDHNTPGHRNLTYGYNGSLGWADGQRNHSFSGGITTSSTSDDVIQPDRPGGQMRYVDYSTWGGDGELGGYIDYAHIDHDFDGELGYTPDYGVYGLMGGIWRDKAYRGRNLQGISWWIDSSRWNEFSGDPYVRNISFGSSLSYTNGQRWSLGISRNTFKEFHDWIPSLNFSWNGNKANKGGGLGVSLGRRASGAYSSFTLGQTFQLKPKLVLGLTHHEEHVGGTSIYAGIRRQMIATLNYDLSAERSIGGRLVRQLGSQNIFLMYRQQMRRGMDIYLIFGDPNSLSTAGKVSLKLVRPFL